MYSMLRRAALVHQTSVKTEVLDPAAVSEFLTACSHWLCSVSSVGCGSNTKHGSSSRA